MIPKKEDYTFSISNCNIINRSLKKRANKDGQFLPVKMPKINFTITFSRKYHVKSGLSVFETEENATYIVNGFLSNFNDTHQTIADWLHEQDWVEIQAAKYQYFFKDKDKGTFYVAAFH